MALTGMARPAVASHCGNIAIERNNSRLFRIIVLSCN